MKAPKRLIEERPSPELARALRAGIELAPPRGAEQAVWTALHAALAASAVSATASAATAGAKSATGATGLVTIFKSVAIGLAAGTVVLGGHAALSSLANAPDAAPAPGPTLAATRTHVAPAEPAVAARGMPAPAPSPAAAERSPVALPRASARPSTSASTNASASASAGAERAERPRPDESAAVLEARRQLRSGDPARALQVLEQSAAQFPSGSLAQERSALEIEALVRAGKHTDAKRKAAAFLTQYPESPHSARIRGLVR
jgi:hypothetical protein